MKLILLLMALAVAATGCATNESGPIVAKGDERQPWSPDDSVLEQTLSRVVKVYRDGSEKKASGTGVLVEYRGHRFVLTASHVAMPELFLKSDRKSVSGGIARLTTVIEYSDGRRSQPLFASTIQWTDIVVLGPVPPEVQLIPADSLGIESLSKAELGDRLVVWGTPLGYGGPSPLIGFYVQDVMVSADTTGRPVISPVSGAQVRRDGALGFVVAVGGHRGHSGGPVFDFSGRLLGFIHAGASDPAKAPKVGLTGIHLRDKLGQVTLLLDERIRLSYPNQR